MSALRALADGLAQVAKAPAILAGVWLLSLLVALGPALMVRESVAGHLGASLEAERGARGVNYDWLQEFMSQAQGPAATLTPAVLGFAAVLDNAGAFIDGRRRPLVVSLATGASLLAWLFLSGGIIDRYARRRPTGAHGFFGIAGAFFFRFLRLGVIAAAFYAWLFTALHPWIGDLYERLIAEVTVERDAFLIRLGLELPFFIALAGLQMVFDYAKVRAVVEDRRSMVGAIAAALRFLSRHGGAAAALYLANIVLLGLVIGAYALVAPGAGGTGVSMWAALLLGQLYIAARFGVKLTLWASAMSLFQSRLAHAGYVSAPLPTWPDSPTIEAIRRI